jgi:hypothetical protein
MMLSIGGRVQAKTVLMDFGKLGANVMPEGYNHVGAGALTNSMAGGPVIALSDPATNATGWTLSLANLPVNTPTLYDEKAAASRPEVAPDAPAYIDNNFEWTAWRDNMGVESNSFMVLSFEGLDPNKTYDLRFFGARGDQNSSQSWEMIQGTGGNSADVFNYDSTNTSVLVSYTDITPEGTYNGIRVKLSAGAAGRGAINFAELRESSVFALRHPMDPSEMRGGRLEMEAYPLSSNTYYFVMAPEYNGGTLTDTLNLLTGMGVNVLTTRLYDVRQLAEWAAQATGWNALSSTQKTNVRAAQYEGFQRYLIEVSNYNAAHDPDIGVFVYQREHLQVDGVDRAWVSAAAVAQVINDAQNGVGNGGVPYDDALIGVGPVETNVDRISDLCRVSLEWIDEVNLATDNWFQNRMALWPGLGMGACYYAYNTNDVLEGVDTAAGSATFYADIDAQVGSYAWVYKQMLHAYWDDPATTLVPSLNTTYYAQGWTTFFHQSSTKTYDEKIAFLQDEVGLSYLKNLTQTSSDTLLNNVIFWGDAGDTFKMAGRIGQLASVHEVLLNVNGWEGYNSTEIIGPVFRQPNDVPWFIVQNGEHVLADNDMLTRWETFGDPDFYNVNFMEGGNAHLDDLVGPGSTNMGVKVITKTGIEVGPGQTVDLTVDALTKNINSDGLFGLGTGDTTITSGRPIAFTFSADVLIRCIWFSENSNTDECSVQVGSGPVHQGQALDYYTEALPLTVPAGQALTVGHPSGDGIRIAGLSIELILPYEQWASGWGVDIGAGANDYDGDGLDNLAEYGMDGNPTDPEDRGTLPELSISGGGFVYIHPKRSDDTDIVYTIETSTDMAQWENTGYTVGGTDVTGGILDFVTNDVGPVEGRIFIRLKIEN